MIIDNVEYKTAESWDTWKELVKQGYILHYYSVSWSSNGFIHGENDYPNAIFYKEKSK